MPPVIASAAASAVMAGFFQGFTVAVLSQAFIGSLVLGGLSMALSPKPKKPAAQTQQVTSNTYTIRQADVTRKHIYGLTRFTDCYGQIVSTGVNGKIHAAILICDDFGAGWNEIWVDDYPITPDMLDADGNVTTGRYANNLRLRVHLGDPNQVADSVMVAEVPEWNSNCRLRGIFYIYVTLTKNQDVYPNGLPNFSVVGRFRQLYDPRTGTTRWTPNVVLFTYDFMARADFGYEALADDINLTNVSAQANIADEIVTTTSVDVDVVTVTAATDIITLDGDRLQLFTGDRVELVTGGTPPAGLATGTAYYVIIYQIKATPRIKLATSLTNAIDGTAIDITDAGSGSFIIRKTGEPRYHGAGVVDTADTLEETLNSMLSSMAGRAICTGGAWRFQAGAWVEPTLTLTEDDMAGGMSTQPKIPMSERFNTIKGLHLSQVNDFQRADYPAVRNPFFIEEDNNRELPRELPLNFTDRPITCKRIAKIEQLRARQEITHTAPFKMVAMQAQVGENIMMTLDRRGWEEKHFEVTQFGFSTEQGQEDEINLVTNLTLRETTELIYEWAESDDDPDFDLAPNTNLPDAFTVTVPTGVAFSSRAVETQDADQVYSLVMSWDAHPDAFVTANGKFEIQFKRSDVSDWEPSFEVMGDLTFSSVLVSSVNTQYDLRIRAKNNLGVRSNWVTLLNAVVGSSGGVGATLDYGEWVSSPGATFDYGEWVSSPGSTEDYEFFT